MDVNGPVAVGRGTRRANRRGRSPPYLTLSGMTAHGIELLAPC
jgi:hypothetical protein